MVAPSVLDELKKSDSVAPRAEIRPRRKKAPAQARPRRKKAPAPARSRHNPAPARSVPPPAATPPIAASRRRTPSPWVEDEMTDVDLRDQRLNQRLNRILSDLSERPTASIPAARGGKNETSAASNF